MQHDYFWEQLHPSCQADANRICKGKKKVFLRYVLKEENVSIWDYGGLLGTSLSPTYSKTLKKKYPFLRSLWVNENISFSTISA